MTDFKQPLLACLETFYQGCSISNNHTLLLILAHLPCAARRTRLHGERRADRCTAEPPRPSHQCPSKGELSPRAGIGRAEHVTVMALPLKAEGACITSFLVCRVAVVQRWVPSG